MSLITDFDRTTLAEFLGVKGDHTGRIFRNGGLKVVERVQQQGTDHRFEVTAVPAEGCSVDAMLEHYRGMVATGQWPNRAGCYTAREDGDPKGKLREVRLLFPDSSRISAVNMVIAVAERYARKPASEVEGNIEPYRREC